MSNSALSVSEGTKSEGVEEIIVVFPPFSSANSCEAMLVDGRCCGANFDRGLEDWT